MYRATARFMWHQKRNISDLECDGDYGHPPLIVIDGKEIRWDEFGRMLMTYEGFHFKLEIFDRSEEIP